MAPLSLREWLKPPRHLLALFAAVVVLPAVALGWLAARTIDQDKALARQRVQDRLDVAAGSLVLDLDHRLEEIARTLPEMAAGPAQPLPDDSAVVTVTSDTAPVDPAMGGFLTGATVVDAAAGRLLYLPFVPPGAQPRPGWLDAAEALEWRARDNAGAAKAYRALADRATTPADRAAALLGLGRCLRRIGQAREALAVYGELAKLGALRLDGVPADLVARHAECATLAETRSPELAARATTELDDLLHPRWVLDRAWFELYSGEARAWLPSGGGPAPPDAARLALADAAAEVAHLHQLAATTPARGRRALWIRDRPFLLVWNRAPGRTTALIAGPSWIAQWAPVWSRQRVAVALTDADAHPVSGDASRFEKPVVMRSTADTGLPWTLRVASADLAADLSLSAGPQRIILGALGLVALLVVAGGYVVARATVREFEIARLQTEFVAAVSHEFRSPLTTMRHMVEMLDQDAVPTEERRRTYYHVLANETERLHRLVEDLLNFQRMEAGRAVYALEPIDLPALVASVAAEFRAQPGMADRLAVRIDTGARINADREALGRALWNLLDNAAKYSTPSAPIELSCLQADGRVLIAVRDHGPGIAPADQPHVFDRFYRSPAAITSGVKGTGIGLAIVRHIVAAHHGALRLESRVGEGSTFTIEVPVCRES